MHNLHWFSLNTLDRYLGILLNVNIYMYYNFYSKNKKVVEREVDDEEEEELEDEDDSEELEESETNDE